MTTITLPTPKYPLGTEFTTRGKHPDRCTVIDHNFTFDSKGELVKTEYVATHLFCGQMIRAHYPQTSLDRGAVSNE